MSELNDLRITARRLSAGVSQSVKSLGDAGYRYLLEAHRIHFQDLSYLQKSFEALTKALQRDRKNPEYYCGLAYLCLLVKDFQTAYRFLEALQLVDSEYADAQFLMDYLRFRAPELFPDEGRENPLSAMLDQSSAAPETPKTEASASEAAQPEAPDVDYDQLYEKVETKIVQRLRTYSQLHLPSLAVEADEIKFLEKHEENLSALILDLHENLHILEEDMDVSNLVQHMRPLEHQLSRIQGVLDLSRRTRKLKAGMNKLTRELMESHKLVDQRKLTGAASEAKLEDLLDRCDGFADRLEELESAGYSIVALEKPYERVISLIESLQEKIDEA